MKHLLLFSILFCIQCQTLAQSVSLIKSYDNTYKATDILAMEDGSVYICGRASMPFVIKLDSAGNELWVKYLPEFPDVGNSVNPEIFSFLHLVSDGNGGVIAYGRNEYNDDTHGLIRLNSDGTIVWTLQNIEGESYNLSNAHDVIWRDDQNIYLILPLENNDYDNIITHKIKIQDGTILKTQSLISSFDRYVVYTANPPRLNDHWLFVVTGNKFLKINADLETEFDSIAQPKGNIISRVNDGYLLVGYKRTTVGTFEVWNSTFYKTDSVLSVYDSVLNTSPRIQSFDTSYVNVSSSQKVNIIKNKGLVVGGNAAWRNMGNTESGTWFAQLNPDDISVKWDTILSTNSGVVKIDDNGRDSYAIGATSLGSYGVEVFRITDLDTFNYQTDFSVSANEDLGLVPLNQLKIYPNPTRDKVSVSWEKDEPVTIQVYGISGALFVNQGISGSQTQLDISQLPAGVYVVAVRGKQTNQTVKLIKE